MKYIHSAFLAAWLGTMSVHGQEQGFGVGGILGEPIGVSFKAWLSDRTAFDAAVGHSSWHHDGWQVHADYLWHNFDWLNVGSGRLPVYFGVGGRVKFADDTQFGIRGPIGVSYMLDGAPVDIFAEVAPILDVAPSVRIEFSGGVGARYWF